MSESDVELHLGAIQYVLSVLIASHHDKQKLAATFDRLISEDQMAALSAGGTCMPDEYRAILKKYRAWIEVR